MEPPLLDDEPQSPTHYSSSDPIVSSSSTQPHVASTRSVCMDSAMTTVLGWAFDVLLIIVYFADIATDILVAREFWLEGRERIAGLMFLLLLFMFSFFTFYGVEYLLRQRLQNQLSRIFQYPLMILLSPLMPVIKWLLEILKPQANVTNGVAGWSNTFGIERSEFATGVAAQEIGSMQDTARVLERIDMWFATCQRSHALLYVESVAAVTQCIVQLETISTLDEASTLQVISMAFSMTSVMSKGYIFCRTFALTEMVLKYLFLCYDLLSFFYCVATLTSNMSSPDITLAQRQIDYFSFAWIMKFLVMSGLSAIASGVALWGRFVASSATCSILVVVSISLAFIAGLLSRVVNEVLKISSMLSTIHNPCSTLFPALSVWYAFCNNAPTMSEFYNRFRYISLRLIDDVQEPQQVNGLSQANNEEEEDDVTASDKKIRRDVWITQRQRVHSVHNTLTRKNFPQEVTDFLPVLVAPEFHPLTILLALINHRVRNCFSAYNSDLWCDKLQMAAFIAGAALYTIGQLFSLAFPFLHFIICHGHQNLLQCLSFYGAAGTMFVIICFAPRIYRFVMFLGMSHYTASTMLSPQTGSQTIESLIEDYFIPQPAHFIANEVDPELLPADLVGVVASFLRREDLDLRAITVEDCRNVSNNMIMSNLSIDVPCTGHHPRH